MTRSCTACHGSRVGNEYLGKNEGLPGDVHFREGRMNCVKCHSGADLHAENADPASASHRYAGAESPKCTDCHPSALPGGDSNPMHQSHGESLSCQVCHSVTYTSCDGCHVAISEKSGKPFFETEATYATFFIGRNPNPGPDRPYAFTPVRHIPISPTSYQYYGENLLPNFDALPTWAYATPHNIQRNTPQNASCEACHGNPQYFLTADKVAAEERKANENVIVSAPPPSLEILRELLASAPRQPRAHGEIKSVTCDVCHASGMGGIPQNPASHASFSAASCAGCHKRP
jgi:thiosulfate/3-mercaptopyruvate sulfurtransferase